MFKEKHTHQFNLQIALISILQNLERRFFLMNKKYLRPLKNKKKIDKVKLDIFGLILNSIGFTIKIVFYYPIKIILWIIDGLKLLNSIAKETKK